MSLMIVEMLLWVGFGLILWAMRDDLMSAESSLRQPAHPLPRSQRKEADALPSEPQRVANPIGQFQGSTIHEYALIDGREYRFAHAWTSGTIRCLNRNQRWVAPGLVYVECTANHRMA